MTVTVDVLCISDKSRLKKKNVKKLNREDKALQKREAVIVLHIACYEIADSGIYS